MRGRKPKPLRIAAADEAPLHQIARSQLLPWYQVRRARTVLAVAAGIRIHQVARQLQCSADTVRRTCRMYQRGGLAAILQHLTSPGRPARFSPPAACSDRRAGLS